MCGEYYVSNSKVRYCIAWSPACSKMLPKRWSFVIDVEESEDDSPEPQRHKRYKVCSHRRSFTASTYLGISPGQYRRLKRWRTPRDFLQLLCYSHAEFSWLKEIYDVTEWMSGESTIVNEGRSRGLTAKEFEIRFDPILQDSLGDFGILNAVRIAKASKPLGVAHWDTVCSSWVWVVRACSGRSERFPMGDLSKVFVVQGNCMARGN